MPRLDMMRPATEIIAPSRASKPSLMSAEWCFTTNLVIWKGPARVLQLLELGAADQALFGQGRLPSGWLTLLSSVLMTLLLTFESLKYGTSVRRRGLHLNLVTHCVAQQGLAEGESSEIRPFMGSASWEPTTW